MSETQVTTIETQGKGNSVDAILEQLHNVRSLLDALEQKVEPVPAKYPDTFEQSTFFVSPYVKHGEAFHRECGAFHNKIDAYMMQTRRAFSSMPCKGNSKAWTKTLEHLEAHFDNQCHALMWQLDALAKYYEHIMCMAAMACECDLEAMQAAIGEVQNCDN